MQRKENALTGFDRKARRRWSSMRIGFVVAVGLGVASGLGVGAATWSGGAQGAQSLVHSRASAAANSSSADAHVEAARASVPPGSEKVLLGTEQQIRVIGRCNPTTKKAEVLVLPPKGGTLHFFSNSQTLGFRRNTTSEHAIVGESPPGDRGNFNLVTNNHRESLDGSFLVYNLNPCSFEASGIASP